MWTCPECETKNEDSRTNCDCCGREKRLIESELNDLGTGKRTTSIDSGQVTKEKQSVYTSSSTSSKSLTNIPDTPHISAYSDIPDISAYTDYNYGSEQESGCAYGCGCLVFILVVVIVLIKLIG